MQYIILAREFMDFADGNGSNFIYQKTKWFLYAGYYYALVLFMLYIRLTIFRDFAGDSHR